MEHKELWATTGEVDADAPPCELGRARIVREGSDVTVVSWSKSVLVASEAAELLAEMGISVEVIDLRTLWPWDRQCVFDSVLKTGRLLVVHEAVRVGGFGGEILAEASEFLFKAFRAPPRRLAGMRVPIPYSKPLEDLCRISAADVVRTILEMLA